MTNADMCCAGVTQHESGNLAGMRALLDFSGTVLPSDTDVGPFKPIGNSLERGEHRRNHDLAMVGIGDQRFECEGGVDRLTHGLIHLPVSSDNGFAHRCLDLWSLVFGLWSLFFDLIWYALS